MHHPDTHTHAHIHTHQRQWAVKHCPYPPQKASTNQIRPDQNMPFKVRDGVKGGIQESTAEALTLGAISMTREGERRVESGEAGWNKNGSNAKVTSPLRLEMRVGVLWGPTQHWALVLLTSSHSKLGLFTQDTVTPPMPLCTSPAWTVGPGLPLRKPRPHRCVFFILVLIITCKSYLILWGLWASKGQPCKIFYMYWIFFFFYIFFATHRGWVKQKRFLHMHAGIFLYI